MGGASSEALAASMASGQGAGPVLSVQLGGMESVGERPLRLDESKPLAAIFDVHGTLLEPTWKDSYARAYQALTGEADPLLVRAWIEQNLVSVPEAEVIRRLAAVSKTAPEAAGRALSAAYAYYAGEHPAEAMDGALDFVAALRAKKVPVLIVSGSGRATIVRQLTEAGFLGLLSEENIVGRDDLALSKHRDDSMPSLGAHFPGHEIVHFNDGIGGLQGVRQGGGTNVALPQGEGEEFQRNRETLIEHGADFILRGGWAGWREILGRLKVSEEMQEREARRRIPVSGEKARELAVLLPARREGGLSLHIDVSDDLKTLVYSEVLDDSGVFAPLGVHYGALSLRTVAAFASNYLLSPLRYIERRLPASARLAVDRIWPQGKRYTRYRGITTSWDQAVDRDVWTTNIDTLFLHKRLQDSGLLAAGPIAKALEVGTGGGHIAAFLASEAPGLKELSVTDISLYALRAAKRNIRPYLKAGAKLRAYLGKGLESIGDQFDLILVNPPYIPTLPGDMQDPADPYRGTGLIREIVMAGLAKLNGANPRAGVVINISSMGERDFRRYLAEQGGGWRVERLGEPLTVPLKISTISREWKDWLVQEGGLQFRPDAPADQEPYWHTLQAYRLSPAKRE